MNKKFLIYMVIVAAVAVGIYAYVGGFTEVKITQTATSEIVMAGKPFEGDPESEKLGDIYLEVGKAVEQKQLPGDLGGIFYNNPTKETKKVKAFIGVIVPDSSVTLPAGFELRRVAAGEPVLQGTIDASMMIAPKKLYSALFDYSEEHDVKLQEFYIERYPENKPSVIQIKIQK
ncbi:hypothetical protein [Rufibacter roseus]|uniref:GyrI-like small molecule binding domain-containing protein n=1 Tax=Rufibacter roseus TaxID=1567108 RepID=A0ABW2DIX0_9BACT|nr:hypothetical protein [Rufibacter roseus]